MGSGNGKVDGKGGCCFGCMTPHYCGDSIIDSDRGEECDLGDRNRGAARRWKDGEGLRGSLGPSGELGQARDHQERSRRRH